MARPYTIGLIAAFAILCLFCLREVIRNARAFQEDPLAANSNGWSFRVWFHRFMCIAAFARVASLSLELKYPYEDPHGMDSCASEVIHNVPSFLFFTTYTLLIAFWANLSHASDEDGPNHYLWPFFVSLNICVYVVFAVIVGVTADLHACSRFYVFAFDLLGVMDLLAALGFMYYGLKVTQQLGRRDGMYIGNHKGRLLSRVTAVCVVCTVVFLLRGCFYMLVSTHTFDCYYITTKLPHDAWDAVVLSSVELVPSVLVLALLMARQDNGSEYAAADVDALPHLAEYEAFSNSHAQLSLSSPPPPHNRGNRHL